jgi:predicted DCC family thiol-disulfide oxidoreductase YuxK
MMAKQHAAENEGTVLYDGACGFCSRWVGFWEPTLRRLGFHVAALQVPWVAERLGADPAQLLSDIRLLTPDGKLVSGANVYLYVARRIWWMTPFWALFSLPGLNRLLHVGYRWFARNRYCVSGACRLESQPRRP